jgi:hypothetical protein
MVVLLGGVKVGRNAMARVGWHITGPELVTCNCNWGCPCQFNSRPSQGHCRAAVAMRIDRGHFGEVPLDGLTWAGLFAWPGAIHEGHGEVQPIVDERADQRQREAILTIMSGRESEPGATVFSVFAATLDRIHDPLFRPIAFEVDLGQRTGRISVPSIVEARSEPIRNPVTGQSHRARVTLPNGFEFNEAEFASSTAHAEGPVALDWADRHAHLAMIDMGPSGPAH